MKDPKRAAQTADILASVLDGALRLMHPMIPFITEFIWWKLNEIRADRGIPHRLNCAPSNRLINAKFPEVGEFSDDAEHIFPRLQAIIVAIRNLRNEYKVDPRKTVTVSIAAPAESARQLSENREMLELLSSCTLREIGPNVKAPADSTSATAAGVEIFVEGLVDKAADQQRQLKRCEEL